MGLRPPVEIPWAPTDDVLECMRQFGAPAADIAAVEANIASMRAARAPQSDDFGVWRDNWTVVEAFLANSTQWLRAGMDGQITGLHYGNVIAWINHRYLSRRKRREIFDGIQTMERAALDALSELPKDKPQKS